MSLGYITSMKPSLLRDNHIKSYIDIQNISSLLFYLSRLHLYPQGRATSYDLVGLAWLVFLLRCLRNLRLPSFFRYLRSFRDTAA